MTYSIAMHIPAMYTCTPMYKHHCIHTCTPMYKHHCIHTCTPMYKHHCIHTCTPMYKHHCIYTPICTHQCTHTDVHTPMYTHQCTHTDVHTLYIQIKTQLLKPCLRQMQRNFGEYIAFIIPSLRSIHKLIA